MYTEYYNKSIQTGPKVSFVISMIGITYQYSSILLQIYIRKRRRRAIKWNEVTDFVEMMCDFNETKSYLFHIRYMIVCVIIKSNL